MLDDAGGSVWFGSVKVRWNFNFGNNFHVNWFFSLNFVVNLLQQSREYRQCTAVCVWKSNFFLKEKRYNKINLQSKKKKKFSQSIETKWNVMMIMMMVNADDDDDDQHDDVDDHDHDEMENRNSVEWIKFVKGH